MDVTLTDEQQAVVDLASQILADRLPPERLKELEATEDRFAADVWAELARADLLGLVVPEEHGGGGYGFLELALLLEVVGRTTAPVPLLETLALGALPLIEFGTPDQRAELLPDVVDGTVVLTAALGERNRPPRIGRPATTATRTDGGWLLNGTRTLVPAASIAHRILVPAATDPDGVDDGDVTVFLVDPADPSVALEANRSIDRRPLHTMALDDLTVPDDAVLGSVGGGAAVLARILELGTAATCAVQTGVCEAATRLTGAYASERRQFGSPIATFQAVAHRVADAYVDTEAVRLTSRRAAWSIAAGRDAGEELAVAGFWAADGAHRVVHAAQHVHGGIGVDTDYPIHRLFRWAKALEFEFGHATDHLRSLGRQLAAGTLDTTR